MIKSKKILSLVLCTAILFSNNVSLANAELNNLIEKKKQSEQNAENTKKEVNDLGVKIDEVDAQIKALDYQISKSQAELNELSSQIKRLEEDIVKNENKLADSKEKLRTTQENLSFRLNEQYKKGESKFIEVILGSTSISEMLTKLDYVERVANRDKEQIEFTNKLILFINDTEKQLQEEKQEYQIKLQAEENKKRELEIANKNKSDFMATLEQDRVLAEKKYDDFVNETKNIDGEIVALQKRLEEERKREEARRKAEAEARRKAEEERKRALEAKKKEESKKSSGKSSNSGYDDSSYSYSGSGGYSWPVSGYSSISSGYGYRVHPIFNTVKFHSGIDIPAPTGTKVRASQEGMVIFSGWQGGYGNCVMISHSNNIVTVYAHNSSINVNTGQYVDRGQTIASIGNTGNSTGPHLHFEVRKNGNTVNPLSYL